MLLAIFEIGTFPILLLTVLYWLYTYIKVNSLEKIRSWLLENYFGFGICLLLLGCSVFLIPSEFRILADEPIHVATSLSFFEQTLPRHPIMANFFKDIFIPIDYLVPHRPPFFSFLISLFHFAFGYSVDNVFLLNQIVFFLLLLTSYALGRLALDQMKAITFPILLAAQPIVLLNANSGSFDLLSLLTILYILYRSILFMRHRSSNELLHLLVSAVIMSLVRYENIIYAGIILGFIIFSVGIKIKSIKQLQWKLSILPVLILPAFIQPFATNPLSYQVPDGVQMFSLKHFFVHFEELFFIFFDLSKFHPYATALNFLFLIIAAVVCVKVFPIFFSTVRQNKHLSLWITLALSNFVFILCYFAGSPASYLSQRYFMFFLFTVNALSILGLHSLLPRIPSLALPSLALIAILLYLPVSTDFEPEKRQVALTEFRVKEELLEERSKNEALLIVDKNPTYHIIRRRSAIEFNLLRSIPEKVLEWKKKKLFSEIIVFQRVSTTDNSIGDAQAIPDDIQLKLIAEIPINEDLRLRMSKAILPSGM